MREVITVFCCVLTIIGVAGYKNRQLDDVRTEFVKCNKHLMDVSKQNWKSQQGLQVCSAHYDKLHSTCKAFVNECYKALQTCSKVVENKSNCVYQASTIKREL